MFKRKPAVAMAANSPSPVGGLNAYDSIIRMPETDALMVRNFYPEPYGMLVRKGSRLHAFGFNGAVKTIMPYSASNGTKMLFAVDGDSIYDISVPGSVAAQTPVTTSINAEWNFTQFGNAAGTHLIAFNGADDGFWYGPDGYKPLVLGNGTDVGTWVNVDPRDLVGVTAHQKRLWAVQKDSTLGWYLPPEQLFGEARSFDFGGVFTHGGYLKNLVTWTVDSGAGPDDRLLAISSSGDVAAYSGINPNDPNDWKLDGVFFCGQTLSPRSAVKFGGDVLFLSEFGLLTMRTILQGEESIANNTLSRKIQNPLGELISAGIGRFGWEVSSNPSVNMLVLNVPGLVPTQTIQLVHNLVTQAWAVFTGWHAYTFAYQSGSMFYGGEAVVYRAWEGHQDYVTDDGTGGAPVIAECQQSFNFFGSPAQLKHFKLVRPSILYTGKFVYRIAANVNFDFDSPPIPAAFGEQNYSVWDENEWDNAGSRWGGGIRDDKQWVSVVGLGNGASVRISIEATAETVWVGTDWVFEAGGIV